MLIKERLLRAQKVEWRRLTVAKGETSNLGLGVTMCSFHTKTREEK